MWATYKGDLQTVKYLVGKKANYNYKQGVIYTNKEKTSYYGNLLGIASGENNLELMKYLIEDLKINIEDIEYNPENSKADGWNALQWAVSQDHKNIETSSGAKGSRPVSCATDTPFPSCASADRDFSQIESSRSWRNSFPLAQVKAAGVGPGSLI